MSPEHQPGWQHKDMLEQIPWSPALFSSGLDSIPRGAASKHALELRHSCRQIRHPSNMPSIVITFRVTADTAHEP